MSEDYMRFLVTEAAEREIELNRRLGHAEIIAEQLAFAKESRFLATREMSDD